MKVEYEAWAVTVPDNETLIATDQMGDPVVRVSKAWCRGYAGDPQMVVKVRVTIETIDDPPTKESPDAE